jgi:hypothetical protein
MLHHLAIKVGDVTTATQMVWVVVELHLLVCIAFLEVILCSSRKSSCLSSLQAAVIAAEALAIDIIVCPRHCTALQRLPPFFLFYLSYLYSFSKSQIVTLNVLLLYCVQR